MVRGSGVAGAAADTRKTSGTARDTARTRELSAGTAADTRHAALPTRTAARSIELPAGAAVPAGVATAAARVLLVDNVSGRGARGADIGFSCCHRHHSNRRSNSPANKQWFHEIEFL
jgi:hypothetical protein